MGFVVGPALDPDMAHELLLDFEARGWVQHSSFGDRSGWSVTDAGRTENERRLGVEIGVAAVREAVRALHTDFTCWRLPSATAQPVVLQIRNELCPR
jgi:hypothetical protein